VALSPEQIDLSLQVCRQINRQFGPPHCPGATVRMADRYTWAKMRQAQLAYARTALAGPQMPRVCRARSRGAGRPRARRVASRSAGGGDPDQSEPGERARRADRLLAAPCRALAVSS
jgi:hypothetical protein